MLLSSPFRPLLALGLVAAASCDNTLPPADDCFAFEGDALDFGSVVIGESVERNIRVRNLGCTQGRFRLELVGDEMRGFTLGQNRDAAVFGEAPRDAVANQRLVFAPIDLGVFEAKIQLAPATENAEGLLRTFDIRGTAVTPAQALIASPAQLDFGRVLAETPKTLALSLENRTGIDAEMELSQGSIPRCDQANGNPFCVRPWPRSIERRGGRFVVAAGTGIQLEVQATLPVTSQTLQGEVRIQFCDSSACIVTIPVTGRGIANGLACRPTPLDFGQVNPGSSITRTITCENLVDTDITVVRASILRESDPAFESAPTRPRTLQPGDIVDFEVNFAPTSLGDAQGTLRIETDAPNARLRYTLVTLQGTGGGPDIEVSSPTLDFGRVSLVAPARRNIVITNTGFAPLTITGIEVDTLGTASFTSPDANPTVLQPGESQTITIEFTPRVEGEIISAIRILSNDVGQSSLDINVRGVGVSLAPCQFTLTPTTLDFGIVPRTRSLRRGFEVRNRGTDTCLVTGFRLIAGSDPAFSVEGEPVRSLDIAPGATRTFFVSFAPETPSRLTGQVELSISSPSNPFVTVALSGVGSDGGLTILPEDVDFGTRSATCQAPARTVALRNSGSLNIQIDSIDLANPQSAFSLSNLPSRLPNDPIVLQPAGFTTFDVGFASQGVSEHASAVNIRGQTANSQPLSYVVPLSGRATVDGIHTDTFTQGGNSAKVDLLIVADKTGSMGNEHLALAQGFPALVSSAVQAGVDYQIGITTTDLDDEAGRLISAQVGTTFGASVSGPAQNRIITPQSQPSPAQVFAANLSMRLTGGAAIDESGLAAARLALSPPVILGHNAGFIRRDASLAVLFMSDEPDQSPSPVELYVSFLQSIKGLRNAHLFSASVITAGRGTCNGPGGGAVSNGRYLSVAERTGGDFMSICASDWTNGLSNLSEQIFGFRNRFNLTGEPVASSLEVIVDGSVVPAVDSSGSANWSYDANGKWLEFPAFAAPAPGSQIQVRYRNDCL